MMLHAGYNVRMHKKRILLGVTVALSLLLAACDGDSRIFEEAAEIETLDLVGIEVVPPANSDTSLVINLDEQLQLGLVGISNSGLTFNLSPDGRRWSTSDSSIIAISGDGVVTGLNNGSATVSVSVSNIVSAQFGLTVNDASLLSINSIEGQENLERCVPGEYFATGLFDDQSVRVLSEVGYSLLLSSTATLESTDQNTAVINATTAGAVTISASVGNLPPFERQITVLNTLQSLSVTPNPVSLDVGDTIDFTATGTYASADGSLSTRDITDQIIWFVDESGGGQATVDSIGDSVPGRLDAEEEGTVTLQAFCGTDVTDVGQSVNVNIDEDDDEDDEDDL